MRKFFLLVVLFASSCGWVDSRFGRIEGGSTEASFRFNQGSDFSAQALELYGNIAIYIVGVNGNPYSTNLLLGSKFDGASITVPNGPYKVFAIGWDGDNGGACTAPSPCSPVQGQTRCSEPEVAPIQFSGGSTTVNLELSSVHCDQATDTVYSPGQTTPGISELKPLNIKICGAASTLPTCNTPGSSWDVSMELVVYQKTGTALSVIEPLTKQIGCAASVNNAGFATAKNFAPGSASFAEHPFAYRFRVYPSGSSCSGTLQAEFLFGEGLANYAMAPGSSVSKFDYYNAGASHAQLYLKGAF